MDNAALVEGPASDIDPAQLHAALVQAFADYLIGPFDMPLAQWPHFLARQCIDLSLSRVILRDNDVLAFAFVAPRAAMGVWRLAAMGAVPAARGTGAAQRLLNDLIQRAAHAGMTAVELEVFAQNTRALRLYESHGFQALHDLHGYHAQPWSQAPLSLPSPTSGAFAPLALEEAYAWIAQAQLTGLNDLPLQVTPPVLAANPLQLQAWKLGRALLVFTLPDEVKVQILSLIDRNPAQHDAYQLALQLRSSFPERACFVHELQRSDVGGDALARAGFECQALHQLLMRRSIT
ncbi:GNAT family N-acetyltransferase [Rhodoferax aquaticus]|uniref:GNAT family N-acetyltransferase n=1 Tax=Rhodoferax aquaticus TaxID=2527691 RepID=A0A515EKN6_9BURK|nr:GNAT family N-acetyltransferase [Rhodoferax aquaticus]QDL53232.1 GNAT family N-acetyltransferase [Rhodoferax aquaticus]